MKFAINTYARFENSQFDHILRMDDVFVVTPEFEENPAFIEGLRVGSFQFVEIENIGQLKKVIGLTDEILDEWMDDNIEPDETVEEEVEPEAPPEDPIKETIDKVVQDAVDEAVEEATKEEAQPETPEEGETPPDSVPDEKDKAYEVNSVTEKVVYDINKMKYHELQAYAKIIENKYNVHIDRSQKAATLKATINRILEEHK